MKKYLSAIRAVCLIIPVLAYLYSEGFSKKPAFKVIAFYSTTVEPDHVAFAKDAIAFFTKLAEEKNFVFQTTTRWSDCNSENLKNYQVMMWINDFPQSAQQKEAFKQYMLNGGGWFGFHVAAYNDRYTQWPWFVDFLGGGVFNMNNWPPLPAKLTIDDSGHPVTKGLPATYTAPANEWYQWLPSPRLNKDVKVLVSLDPSNYPLGKKDLLRGGDLPVVWTNTKYNMLYMNMGHGDQIFNSSDQNRMFSNAVMWLGKRTFRLKVEG